MQQLQEAKDAHRCARLLIPHTQMRLLYKPFKCLPTVWITVSASNLKWKHICGSSCQFWLLPPIQCDIMTAAEERLLVSRDGSPESSWQYSWLFNLFLFWQQCSFIFSTIVFLSLPFKWMKAANSAQCCSGWQQWLREPWQHFFSGGIIGYLELVKCCKSEIYSDGLFSFIVCCCCFCTRPVLARWDRTNIGLSVKNIL